MVNQVHLPSSSASNTALSTMSDTSPTWLLILLAVSNVYQIPKLSHNLFSVGQLTELGFSLTFSSIGVVV